MPHASALRVGVCVMRKRLNRFCGRAHLHFLTLSCEEEAGLVTIDSAGGQNYGDNGTKTPTRKPGV